MAHGLPDVEHPSGAADCLLDQHGLFYSSSSFQWRFTLGFHAVFAIYVIALTPFLPETPRWYMRHDPTPQRSVQVIADLRRLPTTDPEVQHKNGGDSTCYRH